MISIQAEHDILEHRRIMGKKRRLEGMIQERTKSYLISLFLLISKGQHTLTDISQKGKHKLQKKKTLINPQIALSISFTRSLLYFLPTLPLFTVYHRVATIKPDFRITTEKY